MWLLIDLLPFLLFALAFLGLWLVLENLLPGGLPLARSIGRSASRIIMRREAVARWVSKRQPTIKPYIPVVVILAAGFVVAMLAGDAFLDLAESLRAQSATMTSVDHAAHDWAASARNDASTRFFAFFTVAGGPAGIAVVVTAAMVACAFERRFRWMAFLLVIVVGGGLLDLELKLYFARARPELSEALRTAHGFSFPSGHAMGSTVGFGALAYLATRVLKTWKWRSAAIALAMTIIISVGFSRVYLGVHWISDIVAGYAAGLLWLATVTAAYEVLRRIRALRAKQKIAP